MKTIVWHEEFLLFSRSDSVQQIAIGIKLK